MPHQLRIRTRVLPRPAPGKYEVVDKLLGEQGDSATEPLDEQEQEQLIREFEVLSSQEHRRWRNVIGGGALVAGLFFLYAAWRQFIEPFGVRYTGELRSVTAAGPVTAVLFVQAAGLLMAAAGMLTSVLPPPGHRDSGCMPFAMRQRALMWSGVLGTAAGAVYWTASLVRMVQVHGSQHGAHWELCWLPAAPLAGTLMCCYVASTLSDTEREIERLRGYRYRFKKL